MLLRKPSSHSQQRNNLLDLDQKRKEVFAKGHSFFAQNSYFAAIKYFDLALKLEERNKEIATDDGVYVYRAFSHAHLGNFKQAAADFSSELELAEKALLKLAADHYNREINDTEYNKARYNVDIQIAITLANRAYVYTRLREYKKAGVDFYQSLERFKALYASEEANTQIIKYIVKVYQNRSRLHYKCERYDAALKDLNKASHYEGILSAAFHPSFIKEAGLFSSKMRNKIRKKQHPEHESAKQFIKKSL